MALDVYVGSLARYYAGEWENIAEKTARERNVIVERLEALRARGQRQLGYVLPEFHRRLAEIGLARVWPVRLPAP